jgi:hypothetical protein
MAKKLRMRSFLSLKKTNRRHIATFWRAEPYESGTEFGEFSTNLFRFFRVVWVKETAVAASRRCSVGLPAGRRRHSGIPSVLPSLQSE